MRRWSRVASGVARLGGLPRPEVRRDVPASPILWVLGRLEDGVVGEVGKKKVDGDMQVRHSASQTQERRDEAQTLEPPSLSNEDGAFRPSIVESRGPGQAGDSSRPTRWVLTGEIPQRVPYDRRAIIRAATRPVPHGATGLKIASYSGTNATRWGGERPGRAMRASRADSMKMGRPCGRGARSARQRVEMVPGSRVGPSIGETKNVLFLPGRAGLSPSGGWAAARQYDGRPGRRSCLRG